jgi:hypothetical protein
VVGNSAVDPRKARFRLAFRHANHSSVDSLLTIRLRFPARLCVSLRVCIFKQISTSSYKKSFSERKKKCGSAGTRTRNQRLKRALLYQLSYRPAQSVSSSQRIFQSGTNPESFRGCSTD